MIKKILIAVVLVSLCTCKEGRDKKNNLNSLKVNNSLVSSAKYDCEIPEEIKSYIASHKEFELLTNKDLKLIDAFVDSLSCPIYVKGDFNNNQIDDIAIIVRYKGYKSEEYGDYNFPFLIIFNDYKNSLKPNIVYKTGNYADESIKTVIYDQFDEGVFSYIKKGKVCNKEVIDIVIPEKSSFFVYWNSKNSSYEFLNYLDDDLCQKLSNNKLNRKNNISNLFENFTFQYSFETDNVKKIVKLF